MSEEIELSHGYKYKVDPPDQDGELWVHKDDYLVSICITREDLEKMLSLFSDSSPGTD